MRKPITKRLANRSTSSYQPFATHFREEKCPECGRVFEVLSSQWAYKLHLKGGKIAYYCRYKCWRQAAKQNMKPLKGETLVTYCGVNNYENLG